MTAARRITYDKNWINEKPGSFSRSRKQREVVTTRVYRVDDLPEMISPKKCAEILTRHIKTIHEWRRDGLLRFEKCQGRYYTTPEWINDFLIRESLKK